MVVRRTARSRSTSAGSASPTATGRRLLSRLALARGRAVLRRHPRRPDGAGQPPPLPLDAAAAITDYWDEVFTADGLDGHAALDDQSAFIASLGSSRSPRMRDVLGTIQADQDAIIRAGSRGALVVDGGPGTGKTVVALHRAAYLLYSDPRLGHRHGGVLFVGPQPALPRLRRRRAAEPRRGRRAALHAARPGARGRRRAAPSPTRRSPRLKASARLVDAVEAGGARSTSSRRPRG